MQRLYFKWISGSQQRKCFVKQSEAMEKTKLLAFCGIIEPIIYAIVLIVLGFLEPEYNHLTDFMSELGAVGAANALAMNLFGFALLGFLIVFFCFRIV